MLLLSIAASAHKELQTESDPTVVIGQETHIKKTGPLLTAPSEAPQTGRAPAGLSQFASAVQREILTCSGVSLGLGP